MHTILKYINSYELFYAQPLVKSDVFNRNIQHTDLIISILHSLLLMIDFGITSITSSILKIIRHSISNSPFLILRNSNKSPVNCFRFYFNIRPPFSMNNSLMPLSYRCITLIIDQYPIALFNSSKKTSLNLS